MNVVLTKAEAAQRLRISERMLMTLAKQGRIDPPPVRLGWRTVRFVGEPTIRPAPAASAT
jgi:hypothetical protein